MGSGTLVVVPLVVHETFGRGSDGVVMVGKVTVGKVRPGIESPGALWPEPGVADVPGDFVFDAEVGAVVDVVDVGDVVDEGGNGTLPAAAEDPPRTVPGCDELRGTVSP